MKKRILSLVVAMCMLIGCMPIVASAATSGQCGNNVYWELDNNGTLTISGTGDMWDYSFDNSNPAPWIGDANHFGDDDVRNIYIQNGVTSIGNNAFEGCGVEKCSIADTVTSIGDRAFMWCQDLNSNIYISSNVHYIGEMAFANCRDLPEIIVDDNNKFYKTVSGVLFDKNITRLMVYPGGKEGAYSIPDSVTIIDKHSFSNSTVTNVYIGKNINEIGDDAFIESFNLKEIKVSKDNKFYSSLDGVLFNKDITSLITYPTGIRNEDYFVPKSVKKICKNSFRWSEYLKRVAIGDGMTQIQNDAFFGCDSLKDVYYNGSESQWKAIDIDYNNEYLTNASIHYNSTMPTGTFGNTNSTSVGAPIITSASLKDSSNAYDIIEKTVNIQEDSPASVDLSVDVDWNGNTNGKIYITQGTKKSIEVPNGKLTFKPGEDLSAGKTVYILAIDEETGKTTSTKVKLKVNAKNGAEWNPDSGTDGFNFKLGQDVGFTIPDSVPVFGGTEIGFGLDFIPITFEYENENKINIAFGLDNSNIDKTTGKFKGFNFADYKATLKSGMKKGKNGYTAAKSNQQLVKELKKKYPDMKFDKVKFNVSSGMDTDVEVSGYAEMSYANGNWSFSEGFLAFNIEFSYEYQGQIFIWVVPCYYEFGGKVGGGIEGTIKNIQMNGFKPVLEGYISAKVGASIGGGVGVAKVCTLGASGEGTLNIKTALHEKYVKSWAEADADFKVKVLGKTVAKKNFAHGEFTIYETGNKHALIKDKNGIELYSANDMYDTISIDDIYENESRVYAENPTEWVGDEPQISLMSADYTNKDLKLLAENIYTESAPQICEVDGKKVMVMQWDNTSRADADRTMLVYSVYDEASKTWSAPVAVADDGTADFYPCFKDGYLVWQNEKSTLTDDMTLADIAALGEICVTKWNGNSFDTSVQITDNNTLDTQPQIASNGSGASVVWTTNTENDILGITGKNTIMQSDFDGVNWSNAVAIKSNINAITNIAAGNINNNFCVAYVADDDNDLNTINDRDIRIISNGTETQLTNNDVLDSNPVFANDMIYYYSDGNISYSDIDDANSKTVFSEAKAGLTDTFVVDGNDNGDIAIWWTKAIEGGAEVYSSLYKDSEWSDEIQVTSIGNKAKYPSGIINNDGSMVVAFNNGILQDNEIVKTDLYTISVNPSYDLEITDAYFDEDSMTAYATVKNDGELTVDGYTVALADNQKIVTEPLKAGESVEIEITYNRPQNFTKRDIELSIVMVNGEEFNTENNSAVFSIGNADIAVENVTVNEEETTVSAEILNIGYDNAKNVKIQLRDSSADGTVIEEKTINLSVAAKENVEFTIDKSTMRFFDGTKQLYVVASGDFDEVSIGNNDGYALISSPSGAADYETEILNYSEIDGKYMINSIARNNTDKSVSCVMYSAVYSSDGTLKACGTVTANVDADNDTGVDIAVPCTIETGDIIKTFMWTDKMEPLAKMGELMIE